MKIIIAPNAFKHSLSAYEAAEAIKAGLEGSHLSASYTLFPIADGGEGITGILIKQLDGKLIDITVKDALFRDIQTNFGIVKNNTAVIELASASGIKWLTESELDPLKASTFGTGQLILKALDLGIRSFVIGLGNSATVDGGAGLLQALGIKFLDINGDSIGLGSASLLKLDSIDISSMDPRLSECKITVACDVENPLLGETGAAQVFGPQKGANLESIVILENALSILNRVTMKSLGKDMGSLKYGGAAGGTAAALKTFLNADLLSGVNYLLNLTGFNSALEGASLLITAEGSLDQQTLSGKGPYGVAKMAKEKGLNVIVLTGQIPADLDLTLFHYFDAVFPIGTGPLPIETAIANTGLDLTRTARQVGNILNLKLESN